MTVSLARRTSERQLPVQVWFDATDVSTATTVPEHCELTAQSTYTVITLHGTVEPRAATGAELRAFVFQVLQNFLPAPYSSGWEPGPAKLPLTIHLGRNPYLARGLNVSDTATLDKSLYRVGAEKPRYTFVVDLRNSGDVDIRGLMSCTYDIANSVCKTTNSTNSAVGQRPAEVLVWQGFQAAVNAHQSPTQTPPHRTRFTTVLPHWRRVCGSESEVENLLDSEQFELFNQVSRGLKAEVSARAMVLKPVIGQPDRIMHTVDSLLIPIEVKPASVLRGDTDLVAMSQHAFQQLTALPDHRWSELSAQDRAVWTEVVNGNCAAKTIIQALGYACANRRKYAIITTLNAWWFLERPEDKVDSVRIAGPFSSEDFSPTIAQCLDYVLSLALRRPACPSPSESRTASPALPKKQTKTPRAGNVATQKGGGQTGARRSTRATGGLGKFRVAQSQEQPLDLPARVVKANGQFQEFTELDVLPALRQISSSTHSTVSEATLPGMADNGDMLTIAMKTIDRSKADNDIMEQLCNEVITYDYLQDLQGTTIPTLHAYGCFQGGQFPMIGTEFIRGQRLSSANVGSVVDNVKAAYDSLHSAGVLHGDVADRNILVTGDVNRPIVLVDFGLSKELTSAGRTSEREAVKNLLATLIAG
ncbi:hypothetical protein HDU87_006671 [Geranomyces variabilis]|uniref:Protein kinase domain-containing protein n=1 Tax=Geranomyces variabilis TaxID=109894 RepID=A0AAD5THA5_9FUNG|nr:hypothetical protein HDU87_006671 [Geranomyces variabilis]